MPNVKVLGHRGSKNHPENTVPAFREALEYADGFEFDIQYTSDGIPVVIHDDTVDRTTNGSGRVDSFTLAELKQFVVLDTRNMPLQGIAIPTLEEVMELATPYIQNRPDIVINIEVKDARATAKTIAIVQDYIANKQWHYHNIILSSFEHDALREAKQLDSNIPLGLLYETEQESKVPALIQELSPYAVHPSLSDLESDVFNPSTCGKPLVAWIYGEHKYPDNKQEISDVLAINPEIIITNHPKEVKQDLQSQGQTTYHLSFTSS